MCKLIFRCESECNFVPYNLASIKKSSESNNKIITVILHDVDSQLYQMKINIEDDTCQISESYIFAITLKEKLNDLLKFITSSIT